MAGGNMGDLYPHHQKLRERVLTDFPHRTAVLGPQSVYFNDSENARRASEVFSRVTNLTALFRDRQSLERAQALFPGAVTRHCPDAAFGLQLAPTQNPSVPIIGLLRTDNESTHDHLLPAISKAGIPHTDWLEPDDQFAYPLSEKTARLEPGSQTFKETMTEITTALTQRGDAEIRRGTSVLSQGQVVVTDRLHAMLLSALIGIPVVAVDTGYGKIRGVYDDWLAGSDAVRVAASPDEAVAKAREFASESAYQDLLRPVGGEIERSA